MANAMQEKVAQAWAARFDRDFNDSLAVIMNKRNEVRDAVVEQLKTTGTKVETIPRHDLEELVDRIIGLTLQQMTVELNMRG